MPLQCDARNNIRTGDISGGDYVMAPQHTHDAAVARRSRIEAAMASESSRRLRDGLLQDLVALGMLTTTLRSRLDESDTAEDLLPLLDNLSSSINRDLDELRALIGQLERAA